MTARTIQRYRVGEFVEPPISDRDGGWVRYSDYLSALATARKEAREEAFKEAIDLVPTSWLDSLLSGPEKVIGSHPYGGPDIERLLNAIRERIRAADSGIISRDDENRQSATTK